MPDVPSQIAALEIQLRGAGYTVADLLKEANVTASSWQRWKNTGQIPLLSTWDRVQIASTNLLKRKAAR